MKKILFWTFLPPIKLLGHVQSWLATEFKACASDPICFPYAVLLVILWVPSRAAFLGGYRFMVWAGT